MAIDIALSSALSGLLTSQTALNVISNNLANLNNPNYSRKVLNEQNRVVNGTGAGVEVGSITRTVDEGLNNSLRTASGVQNQLSTASQFFTQLQNLFGSPSDASSISNLLQTFSDALQTQANSANQAPSGAVQAAEAVTSSLQTMSNSIQNMRVSADQQLSQAVSAVNTSLQNIATLNDQIAYNTAAGISPSDLEDQRDQELNTLSTYMNYVKFTRPDGTISLYTAQGTPLLDSNAETIGHVAASVIQPQMAYSTTGNGVLQGITAGGIDITSQISSGQIASLLQMRDGTLTNLQSELDTLAQTLQTNLNQINNAGTAYPNGGQSMTGTRTFIDPEQQTISLSGGDTSIVLLNSDGSEQARTTVSALMSQYLQANGLPTTNSYSITQLATATNGWLNQQFDTSGITYASVTAGGQFSIQLPQTSSTTIAFRDQHTATFESAATSDDLTSAAGGQALGLSGPLTFRDSAGNVYSYTVKAGDSLQDIANGLNALGGLTATLVPSGSNYQLQVASASGYDMTLDPDSAGCSAVTGLGLNPSRSQPATNVTVNYNSDQQGSTFTSLSLASKTAAAGATGELTFRDRSGVLAQVNVAATDSLQTIAQNINAAAAASGSKINASIVAVGNQVALQVTDTAGNQMSIDGSTSCYQSTPGVWPGAAGGTLSMSLNGTTYTATVNAGDSLNTIAASINAAAAGTGITAAVCTDGTNSWLDISTADGQPLSFTGSALGAGAGQLNINPDARDALGLTAPADQTASGLANFLGLNDLLVTNQPNIVFDSQTLTNSFTTAGATNLELSDATWQNGDPSTGAPQSLNISFQPGQTLSSLAATINAQAVTYDGNHMSLGSFQSSAGTLTIGTGNTSLGTVNIAAGGTLQAVAQTINGNAALAGAGVRALVATDGTNEWLRVCDQQGKALNFSGTILGTATGSLAFNTTQMVDASVISDGAGQRLRITHDDSTELQVTGTLISQTALAASPVGTAQSLSVRSDIQADPSLLSHGTVQYDSNSNTFYAGATDNTALTQMVNALTSPITMPTAGDLGQTSCSLIQYGANVISDNSTNASNNSTQLTYQQTLVDNLTQQKDSVSGVNIDEELSNLISYQQSYQASAKVISTVQQLLDVLDSLIR
jgi:flagellar hook-associated protein FlgK